MKQTPFEVKQTPFEVKQMSDQAWTADEMMTVAAARPVACRGSALGGQGARNRRQAIAFEAFYFRGGHSPVAAGSGFGCNHAVFTQDADYRQRSAKLARDLASRIEKGFHTCQTYGNSDPYSTF